MTAGEPLPFPLGHGSVTTTTRRGRGVSIRHIEPQDATLLVDLFHRLSPETRRLRFFAPRNNVPDEIVWREARAGANIDPLVEAALIATLPEEGQERAVGVARMVRSPDEPATAEVALVVRDDFQGEGLGALLFDLLLQVALVQGIRRLVAITLAENGAMRQLVRKAGLPFTSQTRLGETTMIIELID